MKKVKKKRFLCLFMVMAMLINIVAVTNVLGDGTQPLVYSAPIVITSGGTYQGNWMSDNPDVPAVKILTTEPVTIVNSNIKSKSDLILSVGGNANLTIRNCNGWGVHPGIAGRYIGRFLAIYNPKNLIVENNFVQHTGGMLVTLYSGDSSAGDTIKVRYNYNGA